MTIIVHIVPHAQDIRISATKSAIVLSTIGGVSMAGRFISGDFRNQICNCSLYYWRREHGR